MAPTPALEVVRQPDAAAALLDPVRQQLLPELAEPDSASGLARRLRLPRQRINYHLRALETAGLVELVEERRKGNCIERVVRATARAFVISPEALGPLGLTAETVRDRFSSAYLVAAAGQRHPRRRSPSRRGPGKEKKRLATLTLEADVRFRDARRRAPRSPRSWLTRSPGSRPSTTTSERRAAAGSGCSPRCIRRGTPSAASTD